jgi:hypothetical protein
MKHSQLGRVTRLGHPEKEFEFNFGTQLSHIEKGFRL